MIRKILLKTKHRGEVATTTTMIFMIFLVIVISFIFTSYSYRAVNTNLRDAITDANLAAGTIALKNYGKTHEIVVCNASSGTSEYYDVRNITDAKNCTSECLSIFKRSLVVALKAGRGPSGTDDSGIDETTDVSKVDDTYNGIIVRQFTIYNFRQVYEGRTREGYIDAGSLEKWVDRITYDESGNITEYVILQDTDKTQWPDVTYTDVKGNVVHVTETSIYSIVEIPVKGNFAVYNDDSWSTYGESVNSAVLDQLTEIKPGGGII